jgi:hypothetical protein
VKRSLPTSVSPPFISSTKNTSVVCCLLADAVAATDAVAPEDALASADAVVAAAAEALDAEVADVVSDSDVAVVELAGASDAQVVVRRGAAAAGARPPRFLIVPQAAVLLAGLAIDPASFLFRYNARLPSWGRLSMTSECVPTQSKNFSGRAWRARQWGGRFAVRRRFEMPDNKIRVLAR